jgi:hypothetical protein
MHYIVPLDEMNDNLEPENQFSVSSSITLDLWPFDQNSIGNIIFTPYVWYVVTVGKNDNIFEPVNQFAI